MCSHVQSSTFVLRPNMASTGKCLCLALLLLCLHGLEANNLEDQRQMMNQHEQWMAQHRRQYKDIEEKEQRYKVFKANVEFIQSFNRNGSSSHKLNINEFADMTNEEFMISRIGSKHPYLEEVVSEGTPSPFRYARVTSVPRRVDWRKRGVVSPVKNQGQCVATVEGITKIKKKHKVSLSEQELLYCDHTVKDYGCNGGYLNSSFTYIWRNGGLTSEAKYPYKAVHGACKAKKKAPIAKIRGYESVPFYDETALLKAVAHQPVSSYINGEGHHFQFYSGGVFNGPCDVQMTHVVTVVGYGETRKGKKYWILKNSWGKKWGEKGFMRIRRGVKAKEGMCGLAITASYPIA